jgi:NAD-dependent DNA ligase
MAIVSSIEPDAITNTYNDGANTLRRFLQYAAGVSRGDAAGAAAALAAFRDRGRQDVVTRPASIVTQLATALRERGLVVVERVGQSGFQVDLAVRRAEDAEHRVAILVDRSERVAGQPASERLLGHPGVLRATGWRVVHVLVKDWYDNAEDVIQRIQTAVTDEGVDEGALIAAGVRQELDQAAAEASAPSPPAWGGTVSGTLPTTGAQPGAWVASPDGPGLPVEIEVGEGSMRGQSVCFTGGSVCSIRGIRLSREDQERLALQAGLDVRQSVSARLDILVLANPDSHSTKAQRAAQLGVRRIAEPAFWRMAGVVVDGSHEAERL